MIDRLGTLAARLQFLRPVFAISGLLALLVAAYELFGAGLGEEDYLAIAVLGLLWSLIGFASLGLFRHVPPIVVDQPLFARLRRQIVRGFFTLLGISFLALTGAGIYMTYKLISISSGGGN